MARVLDILEYPDETLTTASQLVDLERLPELQEFIDDLIYTMYFSKGVGLAAPQVGVLLRIFTIDPLPINGDGKRLPWVFVNPRVEKLGTKLKQRREGCLSFPGVYVRARRPEWVRVTAHDRHGKEFTMDCTGSDLLSLAVQHENDHLEGRLMSAYADKRGVRAISKWASARG